MEKNLLTELNQIRKMMGLNLLTEAGPWADIISRMAGGVARTDVNLMIGKSLKKILLTDIESVLTKSTSGVALKKGELDILKALDSEIKKTGNTFGKTNAKGLEGVFNDAMKAAKAANDPTKFKLIQDQKKQIVNTLKSTTPSTGAIKNVIATEEDALKILQANLKSEKFPKSFKGSKNIAAGNDLIQRAAKESVGKTEKEALDELEKSFAELEKSIPDSKPWFKNFVKTNLNPIVRDAKNNIRVRATGTKVLKATGTVTAGIFLTSFIMDYGERVSKLSQEHPDVGIWQRMLVAAGEMFGSVTSTTIQTGKGAYETGKEEYGKLDTPNTGGGTNTKDDTNTKVDTNTGGKSSEDKKEKKSSGGGEKESSGDGDYKPEDDTSLMD